MLKTVDCRGLDCPKPVIMTKKELELNDADAVVSIVDNVIAKQNVQKLAEGMGYEYSAEEKDGLFYITIKKQKVLETVFSDEKNLVVLIGSDKMGDGDDKLGTVLMKSFLFALSESHMLPKTLLFLNSGVKLTTYGSDVYESLKVLQDKGVEIMSCGTCLDFYDLKDKLIIGTVTNMYTIVERLNNASNTIKI